MKKIVIFLLAIVGVQCAVNAQRKQSFDEGWRFHRGEVMNAEAVDCDDSQWREVIVPHDFSMEPVAYAHDYREQTTEWKDWQVGPFSRLSIGDWDSGQTVGGTGWYRKTFTLPTNGGSLDNTLRNKSLRLRFDGVYNQAEVWVNGRKAAMNVYGYMPFVVDLNAILKDNANRDPKDERRVTIAVKAVNEGLNCRWYSGSGIYRHVWLETTDRLHVIHLLDNPEKALNELFRVCRKGGEVIIPTYLVKQDRGISRLFVKNVNLFGTTFHQQFTEQTYRTFFEKRGYTDGTYDIVDGRMACDIAVFTKH